MLLPSRRLRWIGAGALAISAAWPRPGRAAETQPSPSAGLSDRGLYEAACATCHGSDGRGATAALSSFPLSPPDLTDCNFATREPDVDWIAVTHSGGPARGFDPLMPAFGDLLSIEEMRRIVGYIRTFCREDDWPRGELNLPRALVTAKAYPEDEAALRLILDEAAATGRFVYAHRFGALSQFELVVPVTVIEDEGGDTTGGVGDVALGYKRVLLHDRSWGGIVSAAAELILPTGSTERGIGSGTAVLEPFLVYGLLLSPRSFVEFQLGGAIPYDRDHADELFGRSALGYRLIEAGGLGRVWTPMVEALGSRELVDGARTHVDLVPQLHVTLSARQHVAANAGVRVPINDREGRPVQLMAYVVWDWFDGGFLEGW